MALGITSSSSTVKDNTYESWKLKFPSALLSFNSIIKQVKDKKIVVFLDYDGTLSPIVEDPERAFMSTEMRATLKEIAKYFTTSIISGRSRTKVQQFVELPELYYAGSHGMDIVGPVKSNDQQGSELYQPPAARELITIINESWAEVEERVKKIIKNYPRMKLTHGRKVLEVRPITDWNKGNAVEFLLETLKRKDCVDLLPIYIGDDRTDEDAFKVLKDCGCGILVSSVSKPTHAIYSLTDPSEVMAFLVALVKWKKSLIV